MTSVDNFWEAALTAFQLAREVGSNHTQIIQGCTLSAFPPQSHECCMRSQEHKRQRHAGPLKASSPFSLKPSNITSTISTFANYHHKGRTGCAAGLNNTVNLLPRIVSKVHDSCPPHRGAASGSKLDPLGWDVAQLVDFVRALLEQTGAASVPSLEEWAILADKVISDSMLVAMLARTASASCSLS